MSLAVMAAVGATTIVLLPEKVSGSHETADISVTGRAVAIGLTR